MRGNHNKYLYTSFIPQKALDTRHKYPEMHMLLVPFLGSVHKCRISNYNADIEPPPMSNPFMCNFLYPSSQRMFATPGGLWTLTFSLLSCAVLTELHKCAGRFIIDQQIFNDTILYNTKKVAYSCGSNPWSYNSQNLLYQLRCINALIKINIDNKTIKNTTK